jgi:hypothetical protein
MININSTPRKSSRVSKPVVRFSPSSVTDVGDLTFAEVLKLAMKSKKEDFLVRFYFEDSNQAFRNVVGRAHAYFSAKSKNAACADVATITQTLNEHYMNYAGVLADQNAADPFVEIYKAARPIGDFVHYVRNRDAAHQVGTLFVSIDNSFFFPAT